jgi:hypothetical protein
VDNTAENTVPPRVHRTYWWKEALIMLAFYGLYSWSRNQFGSANIGIGDKPWQAFHNAERVIRFERAIGLYHEESVQDWFLRFRGFIRFWNTYYANTCFRSGATPWPSRPLSPSLDSPSSPSCLLDFSMHRAHPKPAGLAAVAFRAPCEAPSTAWIHPCSMAEPEPPNKDRSDSSTRCLNTAERCGPSIPRA